MTVKRFVILYPQFNIQIKFHFGTNYWKRYTALCEKHIYLDDSHGIEQLHSPVKEATSLFPPPTYINLCLYGLPMARSSLYCQ